MTTDQQEMNTNTYRMWPNGPEITLPNTHHWDSAAQEVVANDLSWRGNLLAWYRHSKDREKTATRKEAADV